MERRKIEEYRELLLTMKGETEHEITRNESVSTVELDQGRVGRLSRMDALQSQQMALESQRRHEYRLKSIEGALLRIERGEFGTCFVCDAPISENRLNVDPTLTRCRECVVTSDD